MDSSNTQYRARSEELLQCFFDRRLTVEEGEELLAIWDRFPDLESDARKNYKVEFPLVLFSSLERTPLSIHAALPTSAQSWEPSSDPSGQYEFDGLQSSGIALATGSGDASKADSSFLPKTTEADQARPTPAKPRKEAFRSLLPLKYILPLLLFGWVAAMYWEFRPSSESPPSEASFQALARIEQTADAVSGSPVSPLRANRRIATEPLSLLGGSIEMFLKNNVRIVWEGPGEFQLISDMNAFCSQGRLSVFVPPEATGFEVTTPTMSIHDLGTAFVVDVSQERSELHVVKGKVEANGQSKEPLTFTTGLGARVNDLGKILRLPADKSLFVTSKEMRRRAAASQHRENEREQVVTERIVQDPSVVFHLDFEDDELERRSGVRVSGCRRVRGRSELGNALLFEKRRDVVHYPGSFEMGSLTLLATVRIDGLSRMTQTLFTCRDFGEGAVQWQLGRGGILQILIGRGGRQSALNFRSDAVLTPGLYGTWIQLAAVLDGENGTITHYLDGEPVGRNALDRPVRFRLSDMEIGNWTQAEHNPTFRFFDGAIDDIVLFDRALTRKEIRELSYFY